MSLLWLFSWWKNKYIFAGKYKTSTSHSIYYEHISSRRWALNTYAHKRGISTEWKQFSAVGWWLKNVVQNSMRRWWQQKWMVSREHMKKNSIRILINFQPEFFLSERLFFVNCYVFFPHCSLHCDCLLKGKKQERSTSKTVITPLILLASI